MRLSLIIPTKNRVQDLLITMDSICRNKVLPHEILIIDQTTVDQKNEIENALSGLLCCKKTQYINRPQLNGIIEAREYGYKRSTGDIIIFLDDDITVGEDFFESITRFYIENRGIDAVSAVDISMEKLAILRLLGRCVFSVGEFWDNRSIIYRFHKKIKSPRKTKTFHGGFMSCRRTVYDDVGFDLSLKGHVFVGDIDFSYRAARKYNLVIDPKIKVIHRGGLKQHYDIKEAERKRIHAKLFFFKKNIHKNVFNYITFFWLVFGMYLSAISRSCQFHSFKPLQGFVNGFKKA